MRPAPLAPLGRGPAFTWTNKVRWRGAQSPSAAAPVPLGAQGTLTILLMLHATGGAGGNVRQLGPSYSGPGVVFSDPVSSSMTSRRPM